MQLLSSFAGAKVLIIFESAKLFAQFFLSSPKILDFGESFMAFAGCFLVISVVFGVDGGRGSWILGMGLKTVRIPCTTWS